MSKDIYLEDLEYVASMKNISWDNFKKKTIFITGSTGMIGSFLVKSLLYCNQKYDLDLKIIALVRNVSKGKEKLISSRDDLNIIKFIVGDMENIPSFEDHIDFIINGAYPTASNFFSTYPVETIKTGILGTLNMLELARKKSIQRFIFLSSMEVYGEILHEKALTENILGFLDLTSIRSCYPESKRMCENICCCYGTEYGINNSCLRLAQTFGPGVSIEDHRIFAMMARCVIEKKDIVLNTPGTSKHPYLYCAQAVTAILTVLLNGKKNHIYNAANPETYCSIYEMGEMVAKKLANGKIKVRINDLKNKEMYPPTSYVQLDISEIEKLGWKPENDLEYIFKRMISSMNT